MGDGYQHDYQKRNPSRTIITIDVDRGDTTEERELPFVVGVMGDFAGDAASNQPKLKNRRFIDVHRNNFDEVMARISPELKSIRVPNKLAGEGGEGQELSVDLKFEKMEDFEPGALAEKIPALKALLERRERLQELLNDVDRSDALEDTLEELLKRADAAEPAGEAPASEGEPAPEGDE